jgi:NTE family protein
MATRTFQFIKLFFLAATLLTTAGCVSHGVIENKQKVAGITNPDNYTLSKDANQNDDYLVLLAFSGGGTRAAALAYGVMQELHNTKVEGEDKSENILQAVDGISSVSGGSFTAAYYGLYGDQIFEDFEKKFLRQNIEGRLIRRMYLNPISWFNRTGRTEEAVKYYQKNLFHGATYADLSKKDGPLILINASDLGNGVRFTFVQEYFDLLNSDIADFPVARAVAASSAVPVLFDPVLLMNYPGEKKEKTPEWVTRFRSIATLGNNEQLEMLTHGIKGYLDKGDHQYVHFVDGGITDNLGLRATHDIIEMGGGAKLFFSPEAGRKPPKRIVLISVNASATRALGIDKSDRQPSIKVTMGAVTSVQMHRYNIATVNLLQDSLKKWAAELSTPNEEVVPYFIQVQFDDVKDQQEKDFLNAISTSFSLKDDQVDALIKAGRELLRNNPTFQQILKDAEE